MNTTVKFIESKQLFRDEDFEKIVEFTESDDEGMGSNDSRDCFL
jgi:hypothetical protein